MNRRLKTVFSILRKRLQPLVTGFWAEVNADILRQEEREITAAQVRQGIDAKKLLQANCPHHHVGGETHLARELGAGYLICQKCQAIIQRDHPKFLEWWNESAEAEQAALLELASRQPVSEEEERLYAMSKEEFAALGDTK